MQIVLRQEFILTCMGKLENYMTEKKGENIKEKFMTARKIVLKKGDDKSVKPK